MHGPIIPCVKVDNGTRLLVGDKVTTSRSDSHSFVGKIVDSVQEFYTLRNRRHFGIVYQVAQFVIISCSDHLNSLH